MKNLTLILIILTAFQADLFSQSCLPGGITFETQAQIDNFQDNYPGCTEIMGDVTILGSTITNLNGLSVLTSINGYFLIGDETDYNPLLTSLMGLEGLTSIGGFLRIINNNILNSLAGLDNIEAGSITDLYTHDNASLSTCEVQSVCEYLAMPEPYLGIQYNAPGCRWQEEIEAKCGYGLNENNSSDYLITIYPNPASSRITIKTSPSSPNFQFSIYNQNGQQLISRQITEKQTEVDISGLPQGLYCVRLSNDRRVMVRKFVKQNN